MWPETSAAISEGRTSSMLARRSESGGQGWKKWSPPGRDSLWWGRERSGIGGDLVCRGERRPTCAESIAQKFERILQMAFDVECGEAGLRGDFAARHAVGEAKDDADPVDGLQVLAACEEIGEGELGRMGRGLGWEVGGTPLLFEVPTAPIVRGALLCDDEEPCGDLVARDRVGGLVEGEEHLARNLLGDIPAGDGAQTDMEDGIHVLLIDAIEVFFGNHCLAR